MPGVEYIAAMMRTPLCGLASAESAYSPSTRARSSSLASRSGTFSLEPLVLRVVTRSFGSAAFTTSAKASP